VFIGAAGTSAAPNSSSHSRLVFCGVISAMRS
jgi:hypothetical protein